MCRRWPSRSQILDRVGLQLGKLLTQPRVRGVRQDAREEAVCRHPRRTLRQRRDLSHRTSIALHDQRLSGLDTPQHPAGVIAQITNRDHVHVADCSTTATEVGISPSAACAARTAVARPVRHEPGHEGEPYTSLVTDKKRKSLGTVTPLAEVVVDGHARSARVNLSMPLPAYHETGGEGYAPRA